MKIKIINQTNTDIARPLNALQEVFPELSIELSEQGTPLYLTVCEAGLSVSRSDGGFHIAYSSLVSLLRAVSIVKERADEADFKITETPSFDTVGVMVDCSRNSVLKVETVKKLCRIMALMGHNTLMLYTEDTYEIPGRDYFGYMRGRYTAKELRECDEYAARLGIEMVPCIQTLAHLGSTFRWPDFQKICDCNDILLADDERTYQLIDDMLSSMSSNIQSRRIHIGMDEAHMMGLGKYLDLHGYRNRTELMLRHLTRVAELCKKYGYEPIIWDDMFFRLKNPDYYALDTEIDQSAIDMVPAEVTLTYWDYYHTDTETYDTLIKKRQRFNNKIMFAGGAWSWQGVLPFNNMALLTNRHALESVRKYNIRNVINTVWGDNGGACSVFSVMPSLQLYAEACWNGDMSDENLSRRLQACANADFESFMKLELPHHLPGNDRSPATMYNPARYLLFQDVLCGLFDRHLQPGNREFFANCTEILKKHWKKNPGWRYLFDTAAALSEVLELKADMGLRLKEAYDKQNRETLLSIANEEIPELLTRVQVLHEHLCTQWETDYKIFGMEVQDIRFGALKERIKRAAERVNQYLNGQTDCLEELEAPRLCYDGKDEQDPNASYQIWAPTWTATATANGL